MRKCPKCTGDNVAEDGYCGRCRECTMQPLSVKRGTDSQQRLLAEDMEAEAQQFWQCAAIHEARGNESAAAVGRRAHEILTRFANGMKQANDRDEPLAVADKKPPE